MLRRCMEIQIKKMEHLNHRRKIYSLSSDTKEIGTVKETLPSSESKRNQVLKFFSLSHLAGIELELFDTEKNRLGKMTKEKGMDKRLYLFSDNESHVATLEPAVKAKLPSLTIVDPNGNELVKAEGNYGATDFSITDNRINKQVSYVKKRHIENLSFKEQLVSDGGYYNIHSRDAEESIMLSLIAICVALDLYFYN